MQKMKAMAATMNEIGEKGLAVIKAACEFEDHDWNEDPAGVIENLARAVADYRKHLNRSAKRVTSLAIMPSPESKQRRK